MSLLTDRRNSRHAPGWTALYGPYQTICQHSARRLAPPERILILSAKHGLLPLDQVIKPYDLAFGQQGTICVEAVRGQAERRGLLEAEPVIAFGGTRYRTVIRAIWPHAIFPVASVGGPGQQMLALKQLQEDRRPWRRRCTYDTSDGEHDARREVLTQ